MYNTNNVKFKSTFNKLICYRSKITADKNCYFSKPAEDRSNSECHS